LIGRLVGQVVEEAPDGAVVLDVRGVGYEVTLPLGALGRVARTPRDGEGAVTLFVHTHVREDAFLLYGFASREERAVFRQLIGVSSIGPKIALSILGALSVADLAAAVARGETARLTTVPGVGKKTAERICLELKDKLLAHLPAAGAPSPRPGAAGTGAAPTLRAKGELLHGALTRMGFRPAEADRAVASLGGRVEEAPLADLVREALAVLSA
jgi:Holliday junction DNA helicase RuvA